MTNSNSLNNAAYARSPGRRRASHSEASRIAAEGKYRIIRPLVNSMKLRVWVAGVPQSRVKLLDRLAEKHRVSRRTIYGLSLIHISEPTRQAEISYAVFCL